MEYALQILFHTYIVDPSKKLLYEVRGDSKIWYVNLKIVFLDFLADPYSIFHSHGLK